MASTAPSLTPTLDCQEYTQEYDGYLTQVAEFTAYNCGSDWRPNPTTTRHATIYLRQEGASGDIVGATMDAPWDGPVPTKMQRVRVTVTFVNESNIGNADER